MTWRSATAWPGRLAIPVFVPLDVLEAARNRRPDDDIPIVLGDLVAEALPEALAEALRDRLGSDGVEGEQ